MPAGLNSMTAYARAQGADESLAWAWELRGFNSRGLELRIRLPQGWDRLDPLLRQKVQAKIARGSLQISLTLRSDSSARQVRVNREVLARLAQVAQELHEEGLAVSPSADGLLGLPGVVEFSEEAEADEERQAARDLALLSDFDGALESFVKMRSDEGRRLAVPLHDHLNQIETAMQAAGASAAVQPRAIQERLRELVEELLQASPALPQERLAQEAALLVSRSDVREELDRIQVHLEAARALLSDGGAVGRRLDFLCQEFNREVNTLCAKSPDVELTGIGLQLKAAVEQLREQVQNLE